MLRLTVGDIMSTELVTLNEHEDVDLADEIMRLGRIRHLPVINEGILVGLVTHRDILRAQVSCFVELPRDEAQDLNRSIRVSQIMTGDPRTVEPTTPVLTAAKMLRQHKYGCLPVVEGRRLVGIVTEADFVQLVIRALEEEQAAAS